MRKALKKVKPLRGPTDPRHGTLNAYMYWGCRCERCRSTAAENRRRVVPNSHGLSGYAAGCRCQVCKSVKSRSDRDRAQAQREWRSGRGATEVIKADLSRMA